MLSGVGNVTSNAITRAPPALNLIYQRRIVFSGKRKGVNFLEGLLVNAHDDDAVVVRARAAHFETQVQRALFDALQESETGARINRADPRKSEQHQAEQRDQHAQTQINVVERESF